MTKRERAQKAFDKWVRVLRLAHWEIELILEDVAYVEADNVSPDCGAVGKVDRYFSALSATITVAGQQAAEDIEATILHECLHIVVTELGSLAYGLANTQGEETRHAAKAHIDTAEEHVVRILERAFDEVA